MAHTAELRFSAYCATRRGRCKKSFLQNIAPPVSETRSRRLDRRGAEEILGRGRGRAQPASPRFGPRGQAEGLRRVDGKEGHAGRARVGDRALRQGRQAPVAQGHLARGGTIGLRRCALPAPKIFDGYDRGILSWPEGFGRDDPPSLSFMRGKKGLVLMGDVGTGKTRMTSAPCMMCCEAKVEARFFTTNLEFSRWGSAFGDDQRAMAVIDRVVHHGRPLRFRGVLPSEARPHAGRCSGIGLRTDARTDQKQKRSLLNSC